MLGPTSGPGDARGRPRSWFTPAARACVIGLLPGLIALPLSLALQRLFPYPFLFLFLASVMISSWRGGMVAGLLSVLLSTVCVTYFFVPPFRSFAVSPIAETYLAAFVICTLLASWASSAQKRSEQALREARDQLEGRVAERTAAIQTSNAELREREQQLRLLTEVIPQQIWAGTPDGVIDYCNRRLLEYVGRSMDDLRGDGFLAAIHPEDRERFRHAWECALASGQSFEGEWRVRSAQGPYRLFFTRGVPLRRADGTVVRWYGTHTDIEEHKQAERALLQTQADVAHLSRVLTMGELTTSIAHEISQPLTAVVAHGYACLEWLGATPPNLAKAQQTAERIIQDGTRAGAVLSRIRAFFKKETAPREWLDMNDAIQDVTAFLHDEASRRRVAIRTEFAPTLPAVRGDRVQLQQVVLNLVLNGLDAMDEPMERAKDLVITTTRDGPRGIRVRVEDAGAGLSEETRERIFEPFYTTKPQGLGLGLSISRSIVEAHAGRLWATRREGGGAAFEFTLPGSAARDDE
jgi:PAS domain S-box-containing protein